MPNIEEFTAGNIDIRPTEIGVESTAAAGRRMGVYGAQIAQSYEQAGRAVGQIATAAEQYIEHREINTGAKHAADFVVNHNQSWNDFITGKDIDPNDPSRQDQINARINNPQAAKQWRETQLEPDLAQFQQGFLTQGGRQWADHFVNTYRDHIATKAAADQSSMAGAVVQANLEKTTDSLAVATFNDPSSLKTNLDLLDHSISGSIGSSPTISPEVGARISAEHTQKAKQQLVQAAIQGRILKGGNWQAIANDPAYSQYVKPAENAQFERMEKTYQKGQQVADRQIQLLNIQIAKETEDKEIKQSWGENVKFDANTGHATINPKFIQDMTEIPIRNPNSPNAIAQARANIDWAESKQHGVDATFDDPETKSNLMGLLAKPATTETQGRIAVLNAELNHKITPSTRTTMLELNTARTQGAIKDPIYETALKNAQEVLGTDLEGKKRAADFAMHFMQVYLSGERQAGDLALTKPMSEGGGFNENSLIYKTLHPYMRDPTTIMINTMMQRFGITGTAPIAGGQIPIPFVGQSATPPKPTGYPADAKWDAARGVWTVIRNGETYPVLPANTPTTISVTP